MENPKKYLQYIVNAGEGATAANLIDDWCPVGEKVLHDLVQTGLVANVGGQLFLTTYGYQTFETLKRLT
jgi:hypothetical protein